MTGEELTLFIVCILGLIMVGGFVFAVIKIMKD